MISPSIEDVRLRFKIKASLWVRSLGTFKGITLSLLYFLIYVLILGCCHLYSLISTPNFYCLDFFMHLFFLFHIRLSLIDYFFYQLHRFIWILRARSKIIFLINYTVPDRPPKLLQHVKFYIFEILFFESFFFCSFELNWPFEMFDRCIITKKSWYFFIPIISILMLFVLRRSWRFWLIFIPILKLIANSHIFHIFLLLLEIPTHSITGTLIVSQFVIVKVVLFQVLIVITFRVVLARVMHFIGRVTAVIGSSTIGTFESLTLTFDWRLVRLVWLLFLDNINPLSSNLRILFINIRTTYFFHSNS